MGNENSLFHPDYIDNRYSKAVKEWAKETIMNEENFDFRKYEYCDIIGDSHTVIINSFAEKFIQKETELAAEENAKEQEEKYVMKAAKSQKEEMCL